MKAQPISTLPMQDPPGFAFAFNEATATLEVMMYGFWSVELVNEYLAESQKWTRRLRKRGVWFALLIDNSDFGVQSAAVGEALARSVARAKDSHGAPIALVVRGALSKLQAQRVSLHGNVRVHTGFAEARAWIASFRRLH